MSELFVHAGPPVPRRPPRRRSTVATVCLRTIVWNLRPEARRRLADPNGPHSTIVAAWRCPVCERPVPRRRRPGRHRVYCTNSCKQRAYRFRRARRPDVPAEVRRNPRPDRAASYDRFHAIRDFADLSTRRRDSAGRGITACGAFARMSIDTPDRFGHTRFVAAPQGDDVLRARICRRCEELSGVSPGDL